MTIAQKGQSGLEKGREGVSSAFVDRVSGTGAGPGGFIETEVAARCLR